MTKKQEWLPFDTAAEHFGYQHKEGLRRRVRQLRERGYVVDTGNPPNEYPMGDGSTPKKVVLYWVNPKVALVRSDAPRKLLNPKMGKRAETKQNVKGKEEEQNRDALKAFLDSHYKDLP